MDAKGGKRMTREEHIIGLNVMKPYLQKKMREINYEGLGELDALEVGKTIDFAIEAIEALEKAEKYKWHDLRKNPNDLPNVETRVEIVLDLIRSKVNNFGTLVKYGKWAVNGFITPLDVIAWREIEPFEEVSE